MRPGPFAPFCLGTRLSGLALVALAAPLPLSLALAFGAVGVVSLLRVPRRQLAVELATFQLVLGILVGGPALVPCGVLALVTLGLCFLAPEARLLRANGVDRYFVAQDYPGQPMNSHHFVDTKEPWERAGLERALAAFARDVPIARSFVRESFLALERFTTRAPWFEGGERLVWLEEAVEANPLHLDGRFDLARDPPWRVLHAPRKDGGFRLVLTVHHSAADGTGGFLLLGRLLQRYAEERASRPHAPFPDDPGARRLRSLLMPRGLGWIWRMVRRHVKPLDKVGVQNASLLDDESPQPTSSRHELATIPLTSWDGLKEKAQARGFSRNDVLLAAALRAADAWRRERGKPDRSFRVLFPADLRALLGLGPCVQNWVGVVRSDFSIEEVRSEHLPRLVSERVREARELEEAIETPVNLGVLSALLPPWLFREALRRFDLDPRSFFFSFLWSNVRIPADLPVPESTERVWIRGSLGRQPGFGVVLSADGRQLTLALEYLAPLASEEGVRAFARGFLAELERAS